jgi:protein-S-isoprenylcysteine O-methyltransferase Ste14
MENGNPNESSNEIADVTGQVGRLKPLLGILVMLILPPAVVLGSLWALIAASLAVCQLIIRTAMEDRVLQEELEGYRNYTERVRYRLLPGMW